jgi:hypothetical protein
MHYFMSSGYLTLGRHVLTSKGILGGVLVLPWAQWGIASSNSSSPIRARTKTLRGTSWRGCRLELGGAARSVDRGGRHRRLRDFARRRCLRALRLGSRAHRTQEATTADRLAARRRGAGTAAPQTLNYIFFDRPLSFGASLQAIGTALRTDLEWIREHTRIGEAALRWDTRGRAEALLMRRRACRRQEEMPRPRVPPRSGSVRTL